MKNNTTYPVERRYVHIFKSVNSTTWIVNYCADNNYLNAFLMPFDIWNGHGECKVSDDDNHVEVWYEASEEFYQIAKSETMKRAISSFGVEIKFD